ncbi:hypothetical protein M407DRAFT_28838 [Tulasnella calospora MUT 4182]|uniref:Uncharacterized protein n=1 Tax=Tulasnella calospora MUT 4182 TaxID=1051891 RepID=A0A0C3Q0M5_9AGAM|nr:hypothetical protein M407DRAFT_28838 [Tulasnella calospora MUT 4182]
MSQAAAQRPSDRQGTALFPLAAGAKKAIRIPRDGGRPAERSPPPFPRSIALSAQSFMCVPFVRPTQALECVATRESHEAREDLPLAGKRSVSDQGKRSQ